MIVRRVAGWPFEGWSSRFRDFERMRSQISRLFDELAEVTSTRPGAGVFPLINVTEDKDSYYVRAELPGISAASLDISVTQNGLSIAGERSIAAENVNAKYHRREREEGKFSRMVGLPTQIDTSKVDARGKDGILTVVLPKAEPAKPKQISVKSS